MLQIKAAHHELPDRLNHGRKSFGGHFEPRVEGQRDAILSNNTKLRKVVTSQEEERPGHEGGMGGEQGMKRSDPKLRDIEKPLPLYISGGEVTLRRTGEAKQGRQRSGIPSPVL